MMHIERPSKSQSPVSTNRNSFIDSALEVLQPALGEHWRIVIPALIAIVFAPVLIFCHEITFDPALFVTEWLKISIEVIVFFFVLEVVRHRMESSDAKQALIANLTSNYLGPVRAAVVCLKGFQEAAGKSLEQNAIESLEMARHNWKALEQALSYDTLKPFNVDAALISWFINTRNELNIQACGAIFQSLSTFGQSKRYNTADLQQLLSRLETFMHSIEELLNR